MLNPQQQSSMTMSTSVKQEQGQNNVLQKTLSNPNIAGLLTTRDRSQVQF